VTATLPVFIACWALMDLLVISPWVERRHAPAVRALALARTPNLFSPGRLVTVRLSWHGAPVPGQRPHYTFYTVYRVVRPNPRPLFSAER